MPTEDPARSARLVYRAAESPEDDEFFRAINNDRIGYMNSNASNALLSGNTRAKDYQSYVMNKVLLGAVVCLPGSPGTTAAPTPIGAVHLNSHGQNLNHHRHTEIGIDILPEYQGKGYGSEAIRWVLDWAFRRANMHKVVIRAFEWNDGAVRLYEKIGFKREGRLREQLWHDGRYWDEVVLGMLSREWEEIGAKQ
ncbi:Polynucleotide 5'-hydroxyl-kinase grc3 [Elsinoe australis]|uniref:Polynucleotide 5'-hydroxyl-kinase grc3 n=1 Tax=Elsinoe australis TaxID=40998 RepID=A0A2P7Z7H8_9PEZI|nr:Polynucleotide 5'-hydroxyl-kinase grc3 [Elsinoe australis]